VVFHLHENQSLIVVTMMSSLINAFLFCFRSEILHQGIRRPCESSPDINDSSIWNCEHQLTTQLEPRFSRASANATPGRTTAVQAFSSVSNNHASSFKLLIDIESGPTPSTTIAVGRPVIITNSSSRLHHTHTMTSAERANVAKARLARSNFSRRPSTSAAHSLD